MFGDFPAAAVDNATDHPDKAVQFFHRGGDVVGENLARDLRVGIAKAVLSFPQMTIRQATSASNCDSTRSGAKS